MIRPEDIPRIVANYSSDLVYWVLPDETICFISPNCVSVTGFSEDELKTGLDRFKSIISPDSLEVWSDHVSMHQQRVMDSNCINMKIVDKSGDEHWVSHSCQQICDEEGVSQGIRGSFSDISEQINLHVMINEQKTFLEQLLERAAVPIFVLDETHHVVVWNSALQDLTGFSKDDMIGMKRQWEPFYGCERPVLADLVVSGACSDENHLYSNITSSLHIPGAMRAEGWYDNLGGRRRYIMFEASPIVDGTGATVAAIETLLDLTERKLLEEELESSRKMLEDQHRTLDKLFAQVEVAKQEWEDTLDCISDIVLMCDTKGNIQRCNASFCALIGTTYDAINGKSWAGILFGRGFTISDYNKGNGTISDKEGKSFYDLRTFPLHNKLGAVVGTVVNIRDITEIRSVNQELESAYNQLKLAQVQAVQQEKMASVGQLAAGVAHEINNPMGFISSNLSSLAKYISKVKAYDDALLDEVRKAGHADLLSGIESMKKTMKIDFILGDMGSLLEESQDGAERVRRIVQDLKNFSHVDEAECKAVNINDSLDTTLNMLRNEIKYIAELVKDYGEIPLVFCYPQQINQVFMNILVNATHALDGQGTITIRTWQEGDLVRIAFSDTGKGIAPEHLTKIFDPFFTTKAVGKGTGLGLSICYEIIKKHGGEITVQSTVGTGTTFTVQLPVKGQNLPADG
jgi:two-component system NtrC family sensor kinase